MTLQDKQRIEEAAKNKFDAIGREDDGNEMRAWIAGACYEHHQAYNQAIDDLLMHLGKEEKLSKKIISVIQKLTKKTE